MIIMPSGRKRKGNSSIENYVAFKCQVMKELGLPIPSEEKQSELATRTVIGVDNFFHSIICPKYI